MAEFIQNPRRSLRAPARCRTAVVSASGTFEATTEDVGGHGCQLVSPRLVRRGEPVQLVVSHEVMREPLRVAGRVAWASDQAPWRLGIAYDESALGATQAWFEELLGRVPGLSAFRRIPDRIPVDAVIYLASPPKFLVDFSPDEVALLRAVGSGTSVAELRSLLRDHWQPVLRALFSLLAHQHVTLSRGGSVHPDAWRKILADAEASLAVESLHAAPDLPPAPLSLPHPQGQPTRTPAPPRAAPPPALTPTPAMSAVPGMRSLTPVPVRSTAPFAPAMPTPPAVPARTPSPVAPAQIAVPPSLAAAPGTSSSPAPAGWPDPFAPAAAQPAPASDAPDWLVSAAEMMAATWQTAGAAPASAPARGGSRMERGAEWNAAPPPLTGGFVPPPSSSPRSHEAQGCYERALAELQAGRKAGAMALLRRALALAPGDPEIAGALARLSRPA